MSFASNRGTNRGPQAPGMSTVSVKAGQKVVKRSELIHTVQLHVHVKLLRSTAPEEFCRHAP